MPADAPTDIAAALGAMAAADVRFVVVGAHGAGEALGLVVSRHPTNLAALGDALDRLGSTLRSEPAEQAGAAHDEGPRRVGDELGTVAVRVGALHVDLYFGGAHQSLYAETFERSEERAIEGVSVRWAPAPAEPGPSPPVTSSALSRRLTALAERLGEVIERDHADDEEDGPQS